MKSKKRNIAFIIIGWIAAVFVLFPLYIMVINSFKSRIQIFTNQLNLPKSLDFTYYVQAFKAMDFGNALKNSLIITIVTVIFDIIFTSMGAWALLRWKSKISSLIYYSLIATMLIPFQSIMIPLIQYMSKWSISAINFSMIDSHYGLIFMNVGFDLSLGIFLYLGFMKSIPEEMEEAATIDGCNKFQLFWKIVFPNLQSMTVTVAILIVVSRWNDYLLPSLTLKSPGMKTIPLSTFGFFGNYTVAWNMLLAGLVLTVVPVVIFYIFAQKYIIKGVIAGSIK
jgi:raffinose/stachyose/melibiose transport system permease protein